MPQNINTTDSDLYSDASAPAAAEASSPAEDASTAPEGGDEESGEEESGGATALLPISFFGGEVKPGDTCTVTVTRVHDNQVEVKYDKAAEAEEYGSEGEPATAPESNEMASMME